jgi:hypothetical protein
LTHTLYSEKTTIYKRVQKYKRVGTKSQLHCYKIDVEDLSGDPNSTACNKTEMGIGGEFGGRGMMRDD